jgi:putative ABC transport system permease protein
VLLGAIVAAPAATRPIVRLVAAPFMTFGGVVSRMSRENALRNPRRTATTATALMIGLALMAGVSVIASSMRASVADLVESQLTADYVLNGGGAAQFPPSVSTEVAKLPDVASVAQIGVVNVKVGDKTEYAIATTSKGIEDNVKSEVQSGSLASLDSGQVVISESTAKDRGWKVGSELDASIGSLTGQRLTVGAVIVDNQVLNNPALIVPRSLYEKAVPAAMQGDFLVYVKASPGADTAALRTELTNVVKPFIVVSVQDGEEFTNSRSSSPSSASSTRWRSRCSSGPARSGCSAPSDCRVASFAG